MADRLRFHSQVATDLRAATQWYDRISLDLGNHFRALVDARFDELADHPVAFGMVFDDLRCARIRRFPYLVLFREAGDLIEVLGVFHTASDPQKWRQRAADH